MRASASPPPMPPGGPVEHYQYTCLDDQEPRIERAKAQAMLNEMGAQGWRLIGPHAGADSEAFVYCFERKY